MADYRHHLSTSKSAALQRPASLQPYGRRKRAVEARLPPKPTLKEILISPAKRADLARDLSRSVFEQKLARRRRHDRVGRGHTILVAALRGFILLMIARILYVCLTAGSLAPITNADPQQAGPDAVIVHVAAQPQS